MYALIIVLALSAVARDIAVFSSASACHRALAMKLRAYEHSYVVSAEGCFPEGAIRDAEEALGRARAHHQSEKNHGS